MYEPPFMFVQLKLSILCAPAEPVNLPVSGHIGQYLSRNLYEEYVR